MGTEEDNKVRKGYHFSRQIHNHIVFPVKYRKALLGDGVIMIIKKTAESIQERRAIEMEAIVVTKTTSTCCVVPI